MKTLRDQFLYVLSGTVADYGSLQTKAAILARACKIGERELRRGLLEYRKRLDELVLELCEWFYGSMKRPKWVCARAEDKQ